VHLAGVALRDAERVLSANIGRVYRNFTVTATMGRLRSIDIFVVGQASKAAFELLQEMLEFAAQRIKSFLGVSF
jgi:hypothetical protein